MQGLRKGKLRTVAALICMALAGVALMGTGCTSADQKSAEEQQVLQAMRDAGFMFDTTLVKVTGEDEDQATVAGPMTGPTEIPASGEEAPEKLPDNYSEYKSVVLDLEGQNWVIVDATVK